MSTDVRAALSAALRSDHPQYADLLRRPGTTIVAESAGYLRRFQVFDCRCRLPTREIQFHVAFAPPAEAYLLTGSATGFQALLRADGATIADGATARAVALDFFRFTVGGNGAVWRLESAADIPLRPALEEGERARAAAVIAQLGDTIAPPAARAVDQGWRVDLFLLRRHDLLRQTVTVTPDGAVDVAETVLATDLPTPYSR